MFHYYIFSIEKKMRDFDKPSLTLLDDLLQRFNFTNTTKHGLVWSAFFSFFPPAYMEDEEMSLGHALVGDHDEEIIMVALVKTTCMQVEIITNHPTKEI